MAKDVGKANLIVAPDDAGAIPKLAHEILDDITYNVIFDLLLEVHQQEKVARAATAAIRVEKLAHDSVENPSSEVRPAIRVETDTAIYNSGEVYLKGNPLKTTQEILCPRCNLPRLLYPTDGIGARKPDPSVSYCKKRPFIDKPGFDIYGQTWLGAGPGRGKKKKELDNTGIHRNDNGSGNNSKRDGESPAPGSVATDKDNRPPNVLTFPSATCSKCKRCILVTRLNNHMGSCIGNSGRNASRTAAQKISGNGNGNSHSNDTTPSSSQKGTPNPGSRASSPRKRKRDLDYVDDVDDDDDDDGESGPSPGSGSGPGPKWKKFKGSLLGAQTATASRLTKRVILKTKGGKDKVRVGLGPERRGSGSGVGGVGGGAGTGGGRGDHGKSGGTTPHKKLTPKSVLRGASPAKQAKLASRSSTTANDNSSSNSKFPAASSPLQHHQQLADAGDGGSESSGVMSSPSR